MLGFSSIAAQVTFYTLTLTLLPSPLLAIVASCTKRDIAIIGGGMAGASAARTIEILGDGHSYVLLEAEDYIGGRMKRNTTAFKGYTIEEGANWISGAEGSPTFQLAKQYGLVTDQQNWDDVETYDSSGNYIPKKNIPWSELQAAFDCVNERGFVLDKQGTSAYCSAEDCNLRSELTECGWNTNSDPLREAIEWYGFDFENAVEPEHSSLYANPLWNYGYDFQYKDFFVTDPNGYCKIADRYINEKKTSRNLIKLKTVVKEVNWQYGGSYPVRISTPNGCFLAKKVISTVSVGVLDKNSAMFHPQLMQNVMAMKRVFKMSNYYKIFFQFDRKFWGDSQFIQIATEERGRCNFWQSLHTKWRNKFLYGSNILFCTLTTETIESITNHEDGLDAALDSLLDPLRAIYGNSFVAPLKSHYFPWDEYEYSFGSYENWLPGGTRADFETFIAPVQNAGENVVYISGSATCERHWAYVHGALLAGERTAKMVLKDLGVPNIVTSNSMCDIAPAGGYGSNRPGKVRGAGAGRQLQG